MKNQNVLLERTLLLGTSFLLIIGSLYFFSTVIDSIVINKFGAEGIPLMEVVKFVVSVAICGLVLSSKKISNNFSIFIGFLSLISFSVLMIFSLTYSPSGFSTIAAVMLYVSGSLLINLGLYCVWMLMTSIVKISEGIYFSWFGALAQIGVIISTDLLKNHLNTEQPNKIIIYGCLGCFIAFCIILFALKRYNCIGSNLNDFLKVENSAFEKPLKASIKFISIPYIRLICLIILAQVSFGEIMMWQVYKMAESAGNISSATKLLADFFQYTGWIALFSQLVIVPLSFNYLTARYGLFVLPIIGILSLLSISTSASTFSVFITIATYRSLDFTLNNCMREALFIPLPLKSKVYLKVIIAMLIPRIAKLFSSLTLLLISNKEFFIWMFVILVILVSWLWSVFGTLNLYGRYSESSDSTIEASSVDKIQ
ncbi:hypothetical protein [Microcoleus sp.]|uniref:hypothetical protein n=1 Tax=Microcoleus sp. TaxID=44472 RepID=UPI003526BC63